MALPEESGEFATNETAEIQAPLLSFAKEGYTGVDYVAHEHLNYFFNLYYRFMEAVKAGDATFSQKDSIQQLKDYNVSAITSGYFYVKDIGIYYFDGSKDSPVYNSSIKFKPTTPKTGNKGVYELLLPTPDSVFALFENEFTEIEELITLNKQNITNNQSATSNIANKFTNFIREIGVVASPDTVYGSINTVTNQERTFTVDSSINLIPGRIYTITVNPITPLQNGIIVNWAKISDNNQIQVSLRNTTGGSLTPTVTPYAFSIKELSA